ncbi:MAG TPA: hypothetical protein VGG56_15810 [Terracidiphilus sp.]|jgi:hypothetical protein
MPEPSQQQSKPRSSATAYVVAAAGLGLVLGVTAAFTVDRAQVDPPRISDALSTHTSSLGALPVVYAATNPSLLSQVDNQKKAGGASPLLRPAGETAAKNPVHTHKRHRLHRLLKWKAGARRRPYISPNISAAANGPTGLELATAAAAAGPFFLGIEGDVTVASFDAHTGTIDTYEGSTFMLAKAGENNAIPWDDFPFNVHYRCDETRHCTMVRHGATATVKLVQ